MRKGSVEQLGDWMGQVNTIDRKLDNTPMSSSKRLRVLRARRELVGKINEQGSRTLFNMALMSGDPQTVIRVIRTPDFIRISDFQII